MMEDFHNINDVWSKLDYVIYTPKVTVGADFNIEHFDYIFSFSHPLSCPVETTFQMIGRIRKPKTPYVHLYVKEIKQTNLPLSYEDIKEELFNQEEFNVKKVTSTKSKIKFLQEIKDLTGCQDNNDIIVKNPLDLKDADFYATNYNKVWNASIKKTDIDFTKKEVLTQYMYKMYKNLFGNELVKNDKIMKDYKRITEYTFDDKILQREETLYNFRKRSTQN